MADIVVSVPGHEWEGWRAAAEIAGGFEWRGTASPPPVKAGDRVYVASLGRIQAVGTATSATVLGEKLPPTTSWGRERQPWLLVTEDYFPIDDGPPMISLAKWRYYRFWGAADG